MRLAALPFLTLVGLGCVTSCADRNSGAAQTQPRRAETYTNAPSQFRFPPRLGGFERDKVTEYDPQGQDVGVGYNHPTEGIAMTVFVYPIPQRPPDHTLSGHFLNCKAEVLRGRSGAQVVSEEAGKISPGGVLRSGRHATFAYTEMFAQERQAVRSELFLFAHGQRFVKYRVTYPTGQQTRGEPVIRAFMDGLEWP